MIFTGDYETLSPSDTWAEVCKIFPGVEWCHKLAESSLALKTNLAEVDLSICTVPENYRRHMQRKNSHFS